MCLGTFSRRARSLATYYIFARVRIPAEHFVLYLTNVQDLSMCMSAKNMCVFAMDTVP